MHTVGYDGSHSPPPPDVVEVTGCSGVEAIGVGGIGRVAARNGVAAGDELFVDMDVTDPDVAEQPVVDVTVGRVEVSPTRRPRTRSLSATVASSA
jgi:hypothetical protein